MSAAQDRGGSARSGGRPPSPGPGSRQDSPRHLSEARQRRQNSSGDRDTESGERRPARRNPGIPWEAKIVGHKGVPLLFVLPEDEQKGAS